jgi:predicted nucleotidyltransferase
VSGRDFLINTEELGTFLAGYGFIEFALLFGSFACGAPQPWSDVDIGVYLSRPLSLLEQGQLTAALERHLGRDVDLLVLNTALDHNPALAYRAITEGTLLFCRDRKTFVDCKTRAMVRLRYRSSILPFETIRSGHLLYVGNE